MKKTSESIGKMIALISRDNAKRLTEAFLPYDMTYGQFSYLKTTLEHPGINQDQLTVMTRYDKATTARSVQKLETAGYLKREIDEQDRRAYRLLPTQKAYDFEDTIDSILKNANQTLTANLSLIEKQQLLTLLKKISN